MKKVISGTVMSLAMFGLVSVAHASEGQKVYQQACFACHATGAAGAPKLDDKAAWKDRIAQGKEVLYKHAIEGKGAMPPKGGRADLSDDAVKAAVDYIVSQAQ